MKTIFSFILLLFLNVCSGQTPSNDPHWQLLWGDEFNTINTSIWDVRNNFDHYGGEPQVYTNRTDNVFISAGNLVIRAKNESYSCPPSALNEWECARQYETGFPYNYTSGYLESKVPFQPQFGYIEGRIKLPYGGGLWPAFWTFSGIDGYQEIDIFEMIPGGEEYCHRDATQHFFHTYNTMTSNIHLLGPDGTCDDPYDEGSVMFIQDYREWHTYGIEWSPSKIIWYVDGYPVKVYQNAQLDAPTTIILNLAVNPYVAVTSAFPADMLVDYVRVYSLVEECTEYINTTNYDFSSYNDKVKNFISIGDASSNNTLVSGDDVLIRASQYIDINEITIPLGASFYADANKNCSDDISEFCTETFNPCVYNFNSYDNSTKKLIEIGDGGCMLNVSSASSDLLLEASDRVILKPGVTVDPVAGNLIEIRVGPCD